MTANPEVESPSQTYDQEVAKLRNWIDIRLAWLDQNMPGTADNCTFNGPGYKSNEIIFRMFPNPATSDLFLESDNQISSVEIYSLSGKMVYSESSSGLYSWHLNVGSFEPGTYVVLTNTVNGYSKSDKLIIQ